MSELRWSIDKPNKPALWAYSRTGSPTSIDGICFGPNTAPANHFYCYLGPIPVIKSPITYRTPNSESDIGKEVEKEECVYKYNPDSITRIWAKDYIITGYRIINKVKEFYVTNKHYNSSIWYKPEVLRIKE